MSRTPGTLLGEHAYTPAGHAVAQAGWAAWRAAQPATASLPKTYPLVAAVSDMLAEPTLPIRDQREGDAAGARHFDVSDIAVASHCDLLATGGDNVHGDGRAELFDEYRVSFGRLDDRVLPTMGNHEYQTAGAADYFSYFAHRAGIPGRGYYAVSVGNWRWIALNAITGSLWAPGSAQLTWLAGELAAHPTAPKVVVWHNPRWTDGATAEVTDDDHYDLVWQMLYADPGVQITVHGHDHNYQRWDRIKSAGPGLNPLTVPDGITQFNIGCGGNMFFTLNPARPAGGPGNPGRSTYGHDRAFGVLFLRLGPASYDWLFRCVDGVDYDAGTRAITMRAP